MKFMRRMLNGKIHRATVTEANLDYEGSLTIDRDLMDAADLLENEEVHVWNVTRGTRLSTYAIEGEAGSGVICANGAAAHLIEPGDTLIISSFVELADADARQHRPKVVLVDADNHIKLTVAEEVPGPARRHSGSD